MILLFVIFPNWGQLKNFTFFIAAKWSIFGWFSSSKMCNWIRMTPLHSPEKGWLSEKVSASRCKHPSFDHPIYIQQYSSTWWGVGNRPVNNLHLFLYTPQQHTRANLCKSLQKSEDFLFLNSATSVQKSVEIEAQKSRISSRILIVLLLFCPVCSNMLAYIRKEKMPNTKQLH